LVIAAVPQARAFGQRTGLGRPRGGYGLPQMSDQIRNFRREAAPAGPENPVAFAFSSILFWVYGFKPRGDLLTN